MPLRAVRFVAIVLTALVLVATGAHLFEFPAKMALGRDEYFVVQESYRGWAFFGFALVGAIAANLILTVMLYGRGVRSEEHTSELQSLMRISYAVFRLKKKRQQRHAPC